jgi:hypothetical protein
LNPSGQAFCGTCGLPLGAGTTVVWPTIPPPPVTSQRQAITKKVKPVGPILGLVGGGLVLLGSFMPWATIASGFGSAGVAGTEGDGKITLFLALLLVILGVLSLTSGRRLAVLQVLISVLAGIIAVIDLSNVSGRVADISSSFVHASVGTGLYLVLAGAIAAAVGGFAS